MLQTSPFFLACVQAMESGDVEALESAMMAIHRSQVSYYIHRASWFEAAEESLRLLKRQSSQQKIKVLYHSFTVLLVVPFCQRQTKMKINVYM